MNTKTFTNTKEQYVAFIKNIRTQKYFPLYSQTEANTLDKCKERFEEWRKTWERHNEEHDFNDVEFRHRTVITTTSEWEVLD